MTQTAKGQNNTPAQKQTASSQKQRRPGQRQQERQQRLQRRRQRQRILISSIVAVVVIALAGVTIWQYQRIITQQTATHSSSKSGTKTATGATPTATATTASSSPTPSAGPATPPPVTGATTTLPDGLKYIDVKVGSGSAAASGSTVQVQYTGWLASNGKKFDSSYDHGGQPFSVTLGQGQVIKGWDEGLIGVKAGGTRRLIIPASLGYGASGQPPTIPANATLIFDVTVLSVK